MKSNFERFEVKFSKIIVFHKIRITSGYKLPGRNVQRWKKEEGASASLIIILNLCTNACVRMDHPYRKLGPSRLGLECSQERVARANEAHRKDGLTTYRRENDTIGSTFWNHTTRHVKWHSLLIRFRYLSRNISNKCNSTLAMRKCKVFYIVGSSGMGLGMCLIQLKFLHVRYSWNYSTNYWNDMKDSFFLVAFSQRSNLFMGEKYFDDGNPEASLETETAPKWEESGRGMNEYLEARRREWIRVERRKRGPRYILIEGPGSHGSRVSINTSLLRGPHTSPSTKFLSSRLLTRVFPRPRQ